MKLERPKAEGRHLDKVCFYKQTCLNHINRAVHISPSATCQPVQGSLTAPGKGTDKVLQLLKFLTLVQTLNPLTCIETLWVCTKPRDVKVYWSIGHSCSVWEHSCVPATSSLVALLFPLLPHSHLTYILSPLQDLTLWKASLLALFLQHITVLFVLFFFIS